MNESNYNSEYNQLPPMVDGSDKTKVEVYIKRSCPNAPNLCFCTGACREPVGDEEAIYALEHTIQQIKGKL